MRRWRLALVALIALALIGLASCAHDGIEAALVLRDLARPAAAPPAPEPIAYAVDGRERAADLYRAAAPRAALVLVAGAARTGKDDPRLAAFAATLARAGWDVVVPDIASVRALEISADDAAPVADAVRHLAARWDKVGVAAISYAAAPAVLAALEPDVAPHVAFIVAVGPPYDLTRVVTFFTTGFFRDRADGPWRQGNPNAYGKWVFVKANAARLDDSGDRVLLSAIADRRMADEAAPIADLAARLTAQGRAVMALLDNRDPDRVPALIAGLPPRIRTELDRLDLSRRDLSALRAPVIVIHGRDDRIIPASEGAALAAAVPYGELHLLGSLSHADLTPGGLGDTIELWRAIRGLLDRRDRT